jgi:hypothetical protein
MPAAYLPELIAWLAGTLVRWRVSGRPVVCRTVRRSPAWFPGGLPAASRVVPRFRVFRESGP